MRLSVADHPLIKHKISILRDESTPSPIFRLLVEELVTLLAYEATRDVRITKVKIKGVTHEFSTIPGVLEDVVDIILNIKGVVIAMDGDGPKTMRLSAEGPGDVTAELIECDASIQILNPDKVIATLTDKIDFDVEFTVEKGRGYLPASEQIAKDGIEGKDQVVGEIEGILFAGVKQAQRRQ